MNAYSEIYLGRAQTALARMLDFAVNDLGYDLTEFFKLFLSTDYAKRFESGEPSLIVGKSGIEIAYEVLEKTQHKIIRKEPTLVLERSEEYWTGWALAYYQWKTSLKFSEIISAIPIAEIRMLYTPYHEMDIIQFTDKMNELYLQVNPNTRLKSRRMELGISQQQLADLSGIPLRTIQQYEQRQKSIAKANAEYLVILSRVLSCDVEDLIDKV